MSSNQFVRGLVLTALLGYLFTLNSTQARGWGEPQQQQQLQQLQDALSNQMSNIQAHYNGQLRQDDSNSLDRLDSDEDDEDDDRLQLQPASLGQQSTSGSNLYQTGQQYTPPLVAEQTGVYQEQPAGSSADDLRVAASKHYGHHKHGAKGWLDMGAWTGKKGAFGWYDKHPVGKGK